MPTIVRYGAFVIAVFVASAAVAAEKHAAAGLKDAVDDLLTRLDAVNHDPDMTTAKKAPVAAGAMEKFNQQYKGKPLTVRLKVQDVVPSAQGQYLTAGNPDLAGVQFNTAKFQTSLSSSEVLSVSKDSVLAVTGAVSATAQPPLRTRFERHDALKPGSSIAFPLRGNPACRICLG